MTSAPTRFRFLHSADLHLGKPFGGFPEQIRHRLREARHTAIPRLADAAREGGAGVILLAGDTFDAETPAPEVLHQALAAMAGARDLRWVLMPGNHDSLAASELWRRIAARAPENLVLALQPQPLALAEGVTLMPAPCTVRRPGRDLSDWFDSHPADGGLRIGLAHGPVSGFSEEGSADLIAPDRAARAGLDYLALGDWHGQMQVGPRSWYAGTPEADAFKHEGRAGALLVELTGPGALPGVTPVPLSQLRWSSLSLDLLPGEDAAARLAALLPQQDRRDRLVRVRAAGRTGLPERNALMAEAAREAPEFGWFELETGSLATEARPDDLDMIDRSGALRAAAEQLQAEAADPGRAAEDRAVAEAALSRLFALSQEEAE